jgi:hypothetical protein
VIPHHPRHPLYRLLSDINISIAIGLARPPQLEG